MGSKFTSLTNADLLVEGNNFTVCKFQPSSTFCNKISYILGTQNEQKLATCMHTLSYFYGMGSPLHDLQSNLGSLSYGIREGCHKTKQVFTFSYLTVQYSHHPSLTKERSNSGVSDLAMEQKRGLPQNNTNIHLLLFNSPV